HGHRHYCRFHPEDTSERSVKKGKKEEPGHHGPATAPPLADGPDGPPASGGAIVEPAEGHIGRLTDELAQARDQYVRLAADHDNFRKRVARERTETWARAQADVVSSILDALDDLGRVAHLDAGKT